MLAQLRPAVTLLALFTILTGVVYPLVVTGIAQVLMKSRANGSVIVRDGVPVGSSLIGQAFASEKYFQGRPSAAGEKGYDAGASSGSNLGPLSKKLAERVASDAEALRKAGAAAVPADAVTTSASGLDPHISPAFASLQVARIAAARGIAEQRVRDVLQRHIERPAFGLIGEPRVNVLVLNLALDAALQGGAG